ncbi:MAG: CcmD family protein [Ginsengibacter sp.]
MAKRILRLWMIVVLVFLYNELLAQDKPAGSNIQDTMRSHNKIYVVMAVCITILTGLILYLVRIDRKVSKAEKGML